MTNKKASQEYLKGNEVIKMSETKLGKDEIKPKKQSKFQQDVNYAVSESKVILRNFMEFVETASLLIIATFGIYGSLHYTMRNEYKYSVLFSGIVVGLIAMNLLRKFLARR